MINFGKKMMLTASVVALSAVSVSSVQAQDLSFKNKDEFNEAVKSFILENPEVLFESIDRFREKEQENAQKSAREKISEHAEYLTRPDAPSFGNPDGDITIVEFFDYNCGYCKRALPDIQAILDTDPNVRVVFKDMAILGPSSRTAALYALASKKQDKYFEYHVELMKHRGSKSEEELIKIGEKLGLDTGKLKADATSKEISEQLEKDSRIASEVGVQGTPAFIIGSQFIPGYVGEEGLKQAIEEERAKLKNEG